MRRAFTLIELLVVISIIAILAAVLFPVIAQAKGAAYQMVAISNVRGLDQAASQYATDADERFMPAMGSDEGGFWGWYGRPSASGTDGHDSILLNYRGKGRIADPVAPKRKEYLGDHSGFGYNWGYVGSDMRATGRVDEFPDCWNPARGSDLAHPSTTVTFASSGYYSAPWEGGDGQDYDFGFVDPLGLNPTNPNVSFHHLLPRRIERDRTVYKGRAIVAFADGRAKSVSFGELRDGWFARDDAPTP